MARKKETYKVVGPHAYLGHPPGETFEATEAEVKFGLDNGNVEKVEKKDDKDERRSS